MVAFSVENTKNDNLIAYCLKKDLVWEPTQQEAPKIAIVDWMLFRAFLQNMDSLVNHAEKLIAEAGPLRIIPTSPFVKVGFGAGTDEN